MKTLKNLSFILLFDFMAVYGWRRPCRSDYFYSESGFGWFKLHKELQTHASAKQICRGEGTDLVTAEPDVPWIKAAVVDILTQNNIEEIYMMDYEDIYAAQEEDYSDAPSYNVFNRATGQKFDNKEPRAFICYFYGPRAAFKTCKDKFRSDYTYSDQVKGWLKYHPVPAIFNDARLRCHLEGAVIASPLNTDLASAMMTLVKENGGNHFFTGIHAMFSKAKFASIEGVPISAIPSINGNPQIDNFNNEENCIVMSAEGKLWDVPCGNMYQYICYKKQTQNMTKQNECGTTDADYRFESETGSCYKFHPEPRTWSRAYMTCAAEGGHLAIINSEEEARVLARISSAVPLKSIRNIGGLYFAHIGFQDWGEHGTWFTIHGETLQKSGYEKWQKNEPNNLTHAGGVGEYCGSMTLGAELNDIYCDEPLAFICEKDPKSLSVKN